MNCCKWNKYFLLHATTCDVPSCIVYVCIFYSPSTGSIKTYDIKNLYSHAQAILLVWYFEFQEDNFCEIIVKFYMMIKWTTFHGWKHFLSWMVMCLNKECLIWSPFTLITFSNYIIMIVYLSCFLLTTEWKWHPSARNMAVIPVFTGVCICCGIFLFT